jgi:hypothetical protein
VRKSYLAFAILVLVSVTPALGQYLMVIEACSKDVSNSCGPAQPSRGPLMECVKVHFQEFTEPCKAALVRIAVVRESCGGDIHEKCPATKPGAGRILLCIKKHFAALSEPCKEAIGRAAERKVRAH